MTQRELDIKFLQKAVELSSAGVQQKKGDHLVVLSSGMEKSLDKAAIKSLQQTIPQLTVKSWQSEMPARIWEYSIK